MLMRTTAAIREAILLWVRTSSLVADPTDLPGDSPFGDKYCKETYERVVRGLKGPSYICGSETATRNSLQYMHSQESMQRFPQEDILPGWSRLLD